MLTSTFLHIPGIGADTENSLWEQGCRSWNDLVQGLDHFSVGQAEKGAVRKALEKSEKSLAKLDGSFFKRGLGLKDAWRAFPDFKESCVYLDIETDGGQSGQSITTIGVYDGVDFQCFVKGQNLAEFPDYIANVGMVVSFYGANFDLPMIEKRFHGL